VADHCQAVRPAVQGEPRIPPDLGGEARNVTRCDVRKIGDHRPERTRNRLEEIALNKPDPAGERVSRGILTGQDQGLRGEIDADHLDVRKEERQRKGNDARAGADIHQRACQPAPGEARTHPFHQFFRLRPGDQRTRITRERSSAKLRGAEQMLEWLPRRAAPQQVAQGRELRLAERAVEFQIEIEPSFSKHLREEMLGVEAGTFGPASAQPFGGGLEHFEERLHASSPAPASRNRSASSSDRSAWIISSMSPCRNRSRLCWVRWMR